MCQSHHHGCSRQTIIIPMSELVRNQASVSEETLLRQAMAACRESGLSFALWKLPNDGVLHFAASAEPARIKEVNLEETKAGFLFAPFDPGQDKIFLPADEFIRITAGAVESLSGSLLSKHFPAPEAGPPPYFVRPLAEAHPVTPSSYQELVRKCKDAVTGGTFEKLVPSRFQEVDLPSSFDPAAIFLALGQKYPQAMVSVFSSPETGTWIGATPEMLVSVDAHQRFKTVAVAGTQPYVTGTDLKTVTWTQKEIEEQALVERYIISCFKKIRLREFDEHGPRTVIAGNVVHLKTEFEVDMAATRYPQLGSVMLQLLHPTSAVCGMPMEASLAFLQAHEGYAREFYSGYLGPVRVHGESHLFVNLRCMQVLEKKARLYAGGGVLGDSDPEKEWLETELKMRTLLNVIRP